MARNRTAGRRSTTAALLTGCALAALFTAMPRAAAAQSFNGSPDVVAGSAAITTGPGATDVQVYLPETVINWYSFADVDPAAIDFQPVGTTATFTGGANIGDYTVLNRILPLNGNSEPTAATVAFNGTVNSALFGGAPGGNIWFYSPTGIIVGPKAAFNVGSLILTTDDIQFVPGVPDVSDGSIYGPGGVVQFRGTPGSKGFVEIQPGAQITANGNSAYVALVAPRVQQGGAVSANGPIGYIGAEQVDMTINAGLFDISILAGTTDPNGVVHTGTTTGPASTSYYDQKQIMLVAMPKSTALTMLLSGSIGYTPAVNAYDDGSSIVLSAGYGTPVPTAEAADSLGHISIDDAGFTNPVSAYSTGSIDITGASGPVSFGSNAYLFAQDSIDITLGANEQMDALGFLSLNAGRTGKGGSIDISVGPNASLTAGNYIDLSASSSSTPYFGTAVGNATGGAITVDIDGGTFSSNDIYASAYTSGGYDPLAGGTATGGDISFTARNGGSISAGYLSANADAYGGSSDQAGGDAIGGTISLTSQNGMLDFSSVYVEAQAFGGDGYATSGAATGGKGTILLDGGVYDWYGVDLNTDAYASNSGGQGNGATARADAIDVSLLNGAQLSLNGDIDLSASAYGSFNAPAGAVVRGGGINLSVANGSSLTFANLSASAQANLNVPSYFDGDPSTTPDTFGGTISLTVDGGTISGGSAGLFADAFELGALDDAGSAKGGTVAMNLINGSSLVLDGGEGSVTLNLSASGYGAIGDSAADAIGGSAWLTISDSSANVSGTINIAALGLANDLAALTPYGFNPVGFNATGGSATVSLLSTGVGTASLTTGDLIIDAGGDASTPEFYFDGGESYESGYYGGPFQADGGVGTGGTATLNLGGGVFTADSALVTADGSGGLSAASYSGTPFRSGDGRGGSAVVAMTAGTNAIGNLTISAVGYGGDGSPTGDNGTVPALAGDGFGGNASLTSSGGTLQASTFAIDASGYGGAGGDGPDDISLTPATDGGTGTGGTARLVSTAGSTGTLTLPAFTIAAAGIGGVGGDAALGPDGNGGNGIGGTAATQLADGAFSFGPVTLDANGTGGDGVIGGEGSGGTAQFTLIDTSGPSGARGLGALSLQASGAGGLGSTGTVAASGAGSVGLDIEVANAAAALVVDGDFEALSRGSLAAAGSGFSAKVTGALFRVNGDATVDTARDATMAATGAMFVNGAFASQSRSFTETGLLSAYDSIAITAPQGISAEQLRTDGGTTTLLAASGPIALAYLTSFGDVTAQARSIHISNGGRLNVASAQATAGDLFIHSSGALTLQSASATGAMDFAGSSVTANSALASGGNFAASGTNGVTLVSLDSGGSTTLTSTNGSVNASGDVNSASAFAASGGAGVSFGNLDSGGTTSLTSGNGAVSVTNLTSAGLVTAVGRSLGIASPGALTFSSIAANGGAATISTSGNLAIGDGSITGALTLASANGAISSTGTITAGGAVSLNGKTGLDFNRLSSGGTTSLVSASGPVRITGLASAGLVTVSGGSIAIGSAEGLSFDTVDSPGNVSISAAGDLLFDTVNAGADLALNSTGGSLTATGNVTGGSTQLSSANGITLDGDLAAGGPLNVDTRGAFVAHGSASTDDATIVADGGITIASLRSGEITRLTASAGNILVDNLDTGGRVSATGLAVDISSTGSLNFDQARATSDDLRIRTGGDLNAYTLFANQDIDLAAGGTFALSGEARGFNITVTSADIDIADEAQLGVRDSTSEIALFNGRPAQETFIGGQHQSEAYSLDADEITRLFADRGITLGVARSEIASDEGHLTVGDLALTFGTGAANIGSGGFLEISTPTEMSIVGNVALTTASAGDRFIIDPARVELDTDTGSIAMLDANGNPLGGLEVTGDTIAVGTGAALSQLAGLSDFAAINALLGNPGGKADPLRAGTMAFNVADGLFIQNSGASTAADDRRGFAANGLDINTASSATRISINGVILQDGTPVTGLDTAPLVRINGLVPAAAGQYDPLSTINGCAIGIDCSPLPPPPPETGPDYTPPPNDELEPPVTPGNPGEGTLSGTLIELQDNAPLISPPLVDEPITGVGNDDLWVPECKSGSQQEGCSKQGEDQ